MSGKIRASFGTFLGPLRLAENYSPRTLNIRQHSCIAQPSRRRVIESPLRCRMGAIVAIYYSLARRERDTQQVR
jgi:hypothetical protein